MVILGHPSRVAGRLRPRGVDRRPHTQLYTERGSSRLPQLPPTAKPSYRARTCIARQSLLTCFLKDRSRARATRQPKPGRPLNTRGLVVEPGSEIANAQGRLPALIFTNTW